MKCYIYSCKEDVKFIHTQTVIPLASLELFSSKFQIKIPLCTIHAIVAQSSEDSVITVEPISNA
jgi:hypothetical protein